MKMIVIGTDFSRASRNASIYGLQLAKLIDANVILFNAYIVPAAPRALNIGISRYNTKIQMEQRLTGEVNKLKYLNMPLAEAVCGEGNADDAIIKVAHEKHADLIIVGMKGSGRHFRKIFGSTATSLAKKSDIPVLVIPEYANFKIPRNLIFASDTILESDTNVPGQLKQLSRLFKSRLKVVSVFKNNEEKRVGLPQVHENGKGIAHSVNTLFEYPVDTDLRHALDVFIKKHHCDVLAMMPRKHEWIEQFFRKSETRDMIFHTTIPLLILPETFPYSDNKDLN